MNFLLITANSLSNFLMTHLSKLSDNWWYELVVAKLTFQQQKFILEKQITQLSELDLAALLRVLDQNWFDIAQTYALTSEMRNWAKEAHNIRNRWAHQSAIGVDKDDYLRDLDTVIRLLSGLGVSNDIIEPLKTEKQSILMQLADLDKGNLDASEDFFSKPSQSIQRPSTDLGLGSLVRLKAQADQIGVIIGIQEGQIETSYQVFMNGAPCQLFSSQIEPVVTDLKPEPISIEELNAYLSSEQIKHPSTKHLYSLHASRINFIPYQFRPVLKLIKADRPRMLIADEVGVGKTIEAGLILKELQARGEVNSVLVICPKPLVAEKKWSSELKRFDEEFEHLDGEKLKYCLSEMDLDGEWPSRYEKAILPYSLMDEKLLLGAKDGRKHIKGLVDLDPAPQFDLVIIDEAHHLRNTNTWVYRAAKHFCDNAQAVVLLSATPVQLDQGDLFTLLNLIRPDLIPDTESFALMAEPNRYIHQAIEAARTQIPSWQAKSKELLNHALTTTWGRQVLAMDPVSQYAYDLISNNDIGDCERLTFIHKIESLYTFSGLINRTRRRDIGQFTTRNAHTLSIEFTTEQEGLHRSVLDFTAKVLSRKHNSQSVQFMMSTLNRQLASSVFGMLPLLERMLSRQLTELMLAEMDDFSFMVSEDFTEYKQEIKSIMRQAQQLSSHDPKYDALLSLIQDKTQQSGNNKLLIFSAFRHTLSYLEQQLASTGIRFALIHGDVCDEERRQIRQKFSLPKEDEEALDVVLSSEVGCEGLDYQFCDAMVNYDLPWNPMRIEQRIGRIDRYGQQSEAIAIYNFITPGTIDAEIYNRCHLRIGVFNQSIGGNEVILGEISEQLRSIVQDLTLTEAQIEQKLKQLADNEIRLMNEQERLEKEQVQFFGLDAASAKEVEKAKSFWLEPERLKNLINAYFAQHEITYTIPSNKEVVTLTIGIEGREKLLSDFKRLDTNHRKGRVAKDWEKWLKGNVQHLSITFSTAAAMQEPSLVLLHPMHPLIIQASQSYSVKGNRDCHLKVSQHLVPMVPKGDYAYAIYAWQILGVKPDFTFKPIADNDVLEDELVSLLTDASSLDGVLLDKGQQDCLFKRHHQIWINARAQHLESTYQLVKIKQESLESTHRAGMRLYEERIEGADNEKIKRMRVAERMNKEKDFQRRKNALEIQASKAELLTNLVVSGVIRVE